MVTYEVFILHLHLSRFDKTSSVGINSLHQEENKIPYRYFFHGLHLVQTMSLEYTKMHSIHKDGSSPFCTTVGEANVMLYGHYKVPLQLHESITNFKS